MSLDFLFIVIPIILAMIAIDYQLINESRYRRERVREKERRAILQIMKSIKGVNADPDVNDFYKKLEAQIKDRTKK